VLPISVRGAFFSVGRTYIVTVDTALTDFTGRKLKRPTSFSFTPEPWFRVLTLGPAVARPEGTPVDAFVYLCFNSTVDSSIVNSVRIAPPVAGTWRRLDAYSFSFRPTAQFDFDTEYAFTVDLPAVDTEGHHLRAVFQSRTRTVAFTVTRSSPEPSQTHVAQRQNVVLTFSANVDTGTAAAAFRIQPPVTGRLLANRDRIAFTGHTFDLETRYTVTLSRALRSVDGTPLAGPYTLSFTTDGFRLLGVNPPDGEAFASRSTPVTFYCNSVIDSSTVRQAFSLAPAVPGRTLVFGNMVQWTPDAPLAPGTFYRVTVSRALREQSGHSLVAPYAGTFRTTPQ
jgi:hypothetical protein